MTDLNVELVAVRRRIGLLTKRWLKRRTVQPDLAHLLSAMTHLLDAGGKHVRAFIVVQGARLSGRPQAADAAALAVELIHTASLIHDDLPALDDDPLRRGRPTVHVEYDEPTAILAGDALVALAFEVLCSAPCEPEAVRQAIVELARAAGWPGICGGQIIDMRGEARRLSAAELEEMNRRKTGALIEASAVIGATLIGADEAHIQALRRYGAEFGRAFQLRDDLLDVEGDVARLGKATGRDAARKKSTYVTLNGIESTRVALLGSTRAAIAALDSLGDEADGLRQLATFNAERLK